MSMDITGIINKNEYYTNHYFSTVFEENASESINVWNAAAKESEDVRTPWAMLRRNAAQFYPVHDRYTRSSVSMQTLDNIRTLADNYLKSLGYPAAHPEMIPVIDDLSVPVYLEMNKANGAPLLWVILSASKETDAGIMESYAFNACDVEEDATGALHTGILSELTNEELATKVLFGASEPPRFLLFISMNQMALVDRNKWNEKRHLQFDLETIFSRLENTTLQAMAVLLHKDSICPDDGKVLLDELDEQSQKNASGVSQDLKYALRECIELLGNEVLYDMKTRLGRDLEADPVDAGQLTIECLRYMYRMLFVLFIESRPELGYAPIKAQSYLTAYSLESLRDIADSIRDDVSEVGGGYYLHETLAKLYDLIYNGYPKTEEELHRASGMESIHDMFLVAPLKAHIFDPEYTKLLTAAKLRNSCMLRIIDLMSLTRATGRRNSRRGRISYANLGINQLGAVYEALLSYRGFIAEYDLYEVKREGDNFNELDVGYFVPESQLDQYTEAERVRYESGEKLGQLRMYPKGSFIYRLAGREREKSASYYTPEVLTKCLVKYALKELLEGKTADEILSLTICEPAMGSAAFLNEAINQLAEAYVSRKEQETGTVIGYEDRFNELQKVKMFIADRNVFGIDLNPVAVELAEVSLWLNTIYEGGFVPWFNTQLVNGNSLIGARRQCYRVENTTSTSKGMRWYEMAPERVPVGSARAEGKGVTKGRHQVWHFLLGDPGMCAYSDKVIKSLEPDNIKKMTKWSKEFTAPVSENDTVTLLRLSAAIDDLWEKQVALRREVDEKTRDSLSVFGHKDTVTDSHTTIRQKDKIYSELYKSEHMRNAGPYARLKFAMDYWCALWFWPIDQADLLPSRNEFLFDMSLILEGTMESVTSYEGRTLQMSMFPTEIEQMAMDILDTYQSESIVDIPALRRQNPRLDLAAKIAEQNRFMHWELEFADLFAERGGFDLCIGNPPWIKMEWNEQAVMSDRQPLFAVKKFSAKQTADARNDALEDSLTRHLYFSEYQSTAGTQAFLGAKQNYPEISGAINLFKCFLPQAWTFSAITGVSAFVHPEGVYDDPKGGALRRQIYARLRKHFMFANELKLFAEVDHHTTFSLNVYGGPLPSVSFDTLANLYTVNTIEECYDESICYAVPGVKVNDEWCTKGHPDRIIHVGQKELKLFAKAFDNSDDWKAARLPVLHAKQYIGVLEKFAYQPTKVIDLGDDVFTSEFWNETGAQKNGTIATNIRFPEKPIEAIYSGAHIGILNPYFQSTRRNYRVNSDYDHVELTEIPDNYMIRVKYTPKCSMAEYIRLVPEAPWGKIYDHYRLMNREMVGCGSERTLTCAIAHRAIAHVHTVFSVSFKNSVDMVRLAGYEASLPYDFFVRCIGKAHVNYSTNMLFPVLNTVHTQSIVLRALLLNCLTAHYSDLWGECWKEDFIHETWSKDEKRLSPDRFGSLTHEWKWKTPARTDYERRQLLVEIDVLSAMSLGMSLRQLKDIYQIDFYVLQSYEADTWYDANGRIVFTKNRSLTNVGFSRPEFENPNAVQPVKRGSGAWDGTVKNAPAGYVFARTITDDTMPGGPVERTIEYVAPFDRCDREQDYETAWKFFEEKYGKCEK